jgi:hypothetical protein
LPANSARIPLPARFLQSESFSEALCNCQFAFHSSLESRALWVLEMNIKKRVSRLLLLSSILARQSTHKQAKLCPMTFSIIISVRSI